ncbi:MAG TPA: DUF4350 domain-containing protein [Vicinamibacterales bacterium]|nr:DUF4350 domain-containing protein [Vicinamibacterales bacterium]
MRRSVPIWLLVGSPLALLVVWIALNTSWVDVKLPMPPKGEARTNPFYAVQRFAGALGARTTWDRVLAVPPPESVIVLSAWHWSLSSSRRNALERWVESGGRLVVDRTLVGGGDEFERWSGIARNEKKQARQTDDSDAPYKPANPATCRPFQEEREGVQPSTSATRYRLCGLEALSSLASVKQPLWALRDASGFQAMRVRVGRGTVTVINAAPFRHLSLFEGDHASLFVAATGLRRADEVHFLSEDDHPSLVALLWHHGAPVASVALALVGLMLWRGAVRFGPLAASPPAARRSLAEQIRGTGQFALRYGRGKALHAASVRALDEAARRRVSSYTNMPPPERTEALARLTRFDRDSLAAAIHHPALHRPHELRRTIALLEAARRHILLERPRSSHGTR